MESKQARGSVSLEIFEEEEVGSKEDLETVGKPDLKTVLKNADTLAKALEEEGEDSLFSRYLDEIRKYIPSPLMAGIPDNSRLQSYLAGDIPIPPLSDILMLIKNHKELLKDDEWVELSQKTLDCAHMLETRIGLHRINRLKPSVVSKKAEPSFIQSVLHRISRFKLSSAPKEAEPPLVSEKESLFIQSVLSPALEVSSPEVLDPIVNLKVAEYLLAEVKGDRAGEAFRYLSAAAKGNDPEISAIATKKLAFIFPGKLEEKRDAVDVQEAKDGKNKEVVKVVSPVGLAGSLNSPSSAGPAYEMVEEWASLPPSPKPKLECVAGKRGGHFAERDAARVSQQESIELSPLSPATNKPKNFGEI